MRKSEAFNKGKEDGMAGREPNPVGGKTAYALWLSTRKVWKSLNEKQIGIDTGAFITGRLTAIDSKTLQEWQVCIPIIMI